MIKIKLKNGYLTVSKDVFVVLIMDIFATAYYISAKELSGASMMFPGFLLGGIIIFSIFCYLQSIRIYKENAPELDEKIKTAPTFGISKKLILYIVLVLSGLLLFDVIGALVCCWLFLVGAMWILDVRNKWVLLFVPLAEVIFIYFVFVVWLAVPLPEGLLTFL